MGGSMLDRARMCSPQASPGDHLAVVAIMVIAAMTIASAVRMMRSFGRTPEQDAFARVSVQGRVAYLVLALTCGPLALYVGAFILLKC